MKGQSVHKVLDGKLVKVRLEAEKGKIKSIRISGDFFIHPEEKIEALEKGLAGTELSERALEKRVSELIEGNSMQVFGFKAGDLAKAILMAVQ
jgi:lipoate-protein ligase A